MLPRGLMTRRLASPDDDHVLGAGARAVATATFFTSVILSLACYRMVSQFDDLLRDGSAGSTIAAHILTASPALRALFPLASFVLLLRILRHRPLTRDYFILHETLLAGLLVPQFVAFALSVLLIYRGLIDLHSS